MYTNVTTSEYTYTLSEARKVIETEREEKKKMIIQKIMQKFMGLLAISISIAEFALAYTNKIDEGGAFIIMIPLGIYLLITKEIIIN